MNAAEPPGQLYQNNGSDWVPIKLIILIQLLLLVTVICCNGTPVLLTHNPPRILKFRRLVVSTHSLSLHNNYYCRSHPVITTYRSTFTLSAPSGSTHQLDRSLSPSIRRRYIYIYPGFTNHGLLSNHARNSSGMTEPSAVVAAEEGVPHASNNQEVRRVFCCSVSRSRFLQLDTFPFAWAASVSSAYQTALGQTAVVVVVVVVVVVFTLKTVLTSIQYPSLSYSSRQRNEFPWSHTNPK